MIFYNGDFGDCYKMGVVDTVIRSRRKISHLDLHARETCEFIIKGLANEENTLKSVPRVCVTQCG